MIFIYDILFLKGGKMKNNELPIYKDCYEMCKFTLQYIKNFPRNYRYTIGNDLHKLNIEMLKGIMKANNTRDKKERRENIEGIILGMEEYQINVRLCLDLKLLSVKQYSRLVELINSILSQSKGWKRSTF